MLIHPASLAETAAALRSGELELTTGIHATGDPAMNLPWTHAGMPAITVPAGRAENGLPLGLQCVAAFMGDEQLLAWAAPLAEVLAGAM